MTRVLLDASGGVVKQFHDAPGDDQWAIEHIQDVEPILDDNKRARESDGYSPSRDLRRIASIPMVVIVQWMNESGINLMALPKREFAAFVKRKLADPEWFHLRTAGGKL